MTHVRSITHSIFLYSVTVATLLFSTVPASQAVEAASKGFPDEYRETMQRVLRAFTARDFRKANELLDAADQIIPDTPMALNTRGAIAIEEHRYVEGASFCREALKKDPNYFPSRFNLGEIPFMKKDYVEARRVFNELLGEKPKPDVKELLLFRIFLTYLLEKNDNIAADKLADMPFPCDTGAYYYAHAAWEFAHGNREKAASWIRSGDWVFTAARNVYFADVFYDLGWAERPAASKLPPKLDPSALPPPGVAPTK